ncbi:MAG: hypothetical protein EON92_07375 [Burkholderiales bacterium]|nr:MAG: hypothetical protein EON92_07375 [Burkholderiales bacterium]
MKNLINSLFRGKRNVEVAHTQSSRPAAESPLTIEEGSENATRRQLVFVLLRDALRRYGIPTRWVECQMLVVSSRSRGQGMYLRLVLKHWDYRMMNYLHAFQTALLVDIERFEPQSADWLHGISWQLEVADTCPYLEMPDKSFWQEPRQTLQPAAPVDLISVPRPPAAGGRPIADRTPSAAFADTTTLDEEDQTREDLEKLFAIRDQELSRHVDDGRAHFGYEKTQPAPL